MDKMDKDKEMFGLILDFVFTIFFLVVILLMAIIAILVFDKNSVIISKDSRIKQGGIHTIENISINNKEIEHTTDDNGNIISANYIYFNYDDKIKRCKVDDNEYNNIRVGDKVRIKIDIDYSKTTGYIISEEYNYIE
jgi:hypothetical protein